MTYDSRVGAYVIVKQPDVYFYNNRYIRHQRGAWQTSNKLNGAWQPAKKNEVPDKLIKAKPARKDNRATKDSRVTEDASKNRYKGSWQP